MGPSLPARADNCFKAALGFHWIAIGSNEGTGPIYHHPDLPQVRLRVLHDPSSHFTNPVFVRRGEWLEIWLGVSLWFLAFLQLQQRPFPIVGESPSRSIVFLLS